jgi:hypothetical protein
MTKNREINETGSLNKALDTLLYLLAGSAMIILSIAFLSWLSF